ncbi:hypothetical protein [Acuticoccus sediminis]|uniref:hypothetical protein n=1 Tax=Acuticoccus sediminis TaxID=2184697 RepID=UPI001CFD59D2|nr:hypothetical protein [Acuticoccus sediminis]
MAFVRTAGALGAAVSLPSVRTYSSVISALPGLLGWYTAHPIYAETSGGKVKKWNSRIPGLPAFVETASGGGPVLTPNAAGSRYGMAFTSADATQMTWGGTFPLPKHTKVVIADIATPPATRYLLGSAQGGTDGRHNFRTDPTIVAVQIDAAPEGALISRPAVYNEPALYVAAWNGDSDEASLVVNANAVTSVMAGAEVTKTDVYLGGANGLPSASNTPNMTVFDVLIFDRDLVTEGSTAGALARIAEYAATVYGAAT